MHFYRQKLFVWSNVSAFSCVTALSVLRHLSLPEMIKIFYIFFTKISRLFFNVWPGATWNFVCVCTCVYIWVCMYDVHAYLYACMCIGLCLSRHVSVHMHARMYVCACKCAYMHVRVCVWDWVAFVKESQCISFIRNQIFQYMWSITGSFVLVIIC